LAACGSFKKCNPTEFHLEFKNNTIFTKLIKDVNASLQRDKPVFNNIFIKIIKKTYSFKEAAPIIYNQ